jgi:hypothetical protein
MCMLSFVCMMVCLSKLSKLGIAKARPYDLAFERLNFSLEFKCVFSGSHMCEND